MPKIEVMISSENLQKHIAAGEDSTPQFKSDIRNAESLASELAAFANSEGGTLFTCVADDGSVPGLAGNEELWSWLPPILMNGQVHVAQGGVR